MIVCMSRRICVDLYRELTRLKPDWHDEDDDKGRIKVVMTSSASDPDRLAAAHPQQGTPRSVGDALPGCRRSAASRAGARHVAHRDSTRRACTRCTWTSRCAATA